MSRRTMPRQKPGRSKQGYRTPPVFLAAVKHRLGITAFDIDLAATPIDTCASRFYTVQQNSLVQPWKVGTGFGWLNPPFANLAPWVEKAWTESQRGAKVAMLVPAGVGSNWWRDYVHAKAYVLLLNGRITFVGETTCYPKDCCLLLYGPDIKATYQCWTWPLQIRKAA